MARKRMIDPSIWEDYSFMSMSLGARLLYIHLFSYADDDGKGIINPGMKKIKVFPMDSNITIDDVVIFLSEIAINMAVFFYKKNEKETYYQLKNWKKWQSVQKRIPSNIPNYEEGMEKQYINDDMTPVSDYYCSSTEPLQNHYSPIEKNRIEENRNKEYKESSLEPSFIPEKDKSAGDTEKNKSIREIVEYLNKRAGTSFKYSSKDTKRLINARLREGHTVDDFKKVIDKKVDKWGQPPKMGEKDMRAYLRPLTLFGTKFESYLNEPDFVDSRADTFRPKSEFDFDDIEMRLINKVNGR